MNLFYKYKKLNEETLQNIHSNFFKYYNVNLDRIFNEYVHSTEKDSTKSKPSKMKVTITGVDSVNNISKYTETIKYNNKYYSDLLKYEKIISKLRKPHTYDSIREECYHTYGIEIPELLVKYNSLDKNDQKKYLRSLYGINLPPIDNFLKLNKELLKLESDFRKNHDLDINSCYVKCFHSFQDHKQSKLNNDTNKNGFTNYCKDSFYDLCWNLITSERFVSKHIAYSNITKICFSCNDLRKFEPCFSGHRRDWQNNLVTIPGETDISKLLQVTMDEHHTNVTKKGIANFIREQLDNLSTNWNDAIKIAVLLDLYWNLKALSDKSKSINLVITHNDITTSNNEASYTPDFCQDTYKVISSRKYKIANEIKRTIELQDQDKLLYPFTPEVKYSPERKTFDVSEVFAEIQLNCALNPDVINFFKNNFQLIGKGVPYKHKTFKDALSIYTEHFSFTNVSDYYCLESIMGFNLSMKLFDYLWPMANTIMNAKSVIKKEKEELFNKYVTSIVSLLYKIESPYLRLRVTDIIIQSYGHSKYIKSDRYLLSMLSIQTFLDKYVKIINEGYEIIYDSMFYYYGKKFLSNEDRSPLLKELENLINNNYKSFIQIEPDSILSDFAPYDNCKNDFGYVFNELLVNDRGKPRNLYGHIVQNILVNNHKIHSKADK